MLLAPAGLRGPSRRHRRLRTRPASLGRRGHIGLGPAFGRRAHRSRAHQLAQRLLGVQLLLAGVVSGSLRERNVPPDHGDHKPDQLRRPEPWRAEPSGGMGQLDDRGGVRDEVTAPPDGRGGRLDVVHDRRRRRSRAYRRRVGAQLAAAVATSLSGDELHAPVTRPSNERRPGHAGGTPPGRAARVPLAERLSARPVGADGGVGPKDSPTSRSSWGTGDLAEGSLLRWPTDSAIPGTALSTRKAKQ